MDELASETDGAVTSVAELREEIFALSGVDIMQDEDTFKSTYDILDELAAKWQELTDIQQAECLPEYMATYIERIHLIAGNAYRALHHNIRETSI